MNKITLFDNAFCFSPLRRRRTVQTFWDHFNFQDQDYSQNTKRTLIRARKIFYKGSIPKILNFRPFENYLPYKSYRLRDISPRKRFTPVHFIPRTFHHTYFSPDVLFTPRTFHPTDISPHIQFTPNYIISVA